jgi:high-affinity Fe2+/Pb2+ permease
MKQLKAVANVLMFAGLLILAYWLLNLAAYNTWAASLEKDPAIRPLLEYRSNVFFVSDVVVIFFIGFLGWRVFLARLK